MGEMPAGHSDPWNDGRRDAGRHDGFEGFHPRHDGHGEVSVLVRLGIRVRLDYIGDLVQRPRRRDESEKLVRVESGGEAFSYKVGCRVAWCASEDPGLGVGMEELKDCFNDCDGFASAWSVAKR